MGNQHYINDIAIYMIIYHIRVDQQMTNHHLILGR